MGRYNANGKIKVENCIGKQYWANEIDDEEHFCWGVTIIKYKIEHTKFLSQVYEMFFSYFMLQTKKNVLSSFMTTKLLFILNIINLFMLHVRSKL